ncbi:arabinogalactan protein 41-like [Diospyros lotus]|uniref:arabinogalactan protein 41-like n=1 Tax=Diospyros lotus TaxID=55363 RepID=UPI0022572383|nr:arabinogalactan protein 41-like [Diospyros lotus]
MEVTRASLLAVAMLALIFTVFFPAAAAQSAAPAPAPTSDGTTIDQGVACVLMLVALALTYLIH